MSSHRWNDLGVIDEPELSDDLKRYEVVCKRCNEGRKISVQVLFGEISTWGCPCWPFYLFGRAYRRDMNEPCTYI